MRNLMLLLKVQLRNIIFRSGKQFSMRKKAVGLGILAIPAFLFLYISVIYSFMLTAAFPSDYQYLVLYLMGFISVMMLVIFGFQSAGGHLFGFKDYDLLMSLPFTRSQILTSKFLSFLLLEYFYDLFLIVPAMGVVAHQIQPGMLYYIFGLITVLVLPLVPMVLSALLAYISMVVAGKFKYKNLLNNVISLIFVGVILVGSFSIQNLINASASSLTDLGNSIASVLPFMTLLFDGMVFGNITHFVIGLLLNIGIFALFVFIFARYFMKLNGEIKQGYKVKNFKLTHSKQQSVFTALFKKELRTYFSNATYLMNTLIFPIMLAGGCVYLAFIKDQIYATVPTYLTGMFFPLAIGVILLGSLTACTTNTSISIEGKMFDLIKSLPIDVKTLLSAKILLNMVVVIPLNFAAILLATYALNFNIFQCLTLIFILIISTLLISLIGMILNLHYYRLDWENSAMVIKQSLPVFVTLLVGMLVGMGAIFLGVQFVDRPWLYAGISSLAIVLLDILCIIYLNRNAEKLFQKIG